jgi:spore germination protein YaaH
MRDKYIELIREYIKAKPEYKTTLNEIKADVLTVGATEEEFDEAIRQITGADTSKLILEEPEEQTEKKPLIDPSSKAAKFANHAKHHIVAKKKHLAVTAALIIIALIVVVGLGGRGVPKIAINTSSVKIPITADGAIPLVYANIKTVDPNKIFSGTTKTTPLKVSGKSKKEILGFFPYWMLPKADDVDLATLTSISLFGLEVDGKGNIVTNGANDDTTGGWGMWKDPKLDDFIAKAKDQNISVYLTLKCFDSGNIESIALSDTAQKNLIDNAMYLVNSKDLKGINIDFEYVGSPTQKVIDGFTKFITGLNTEMKRQIPDSVLTIDTYLVSGSEQDIFNIPAIAKNSDAFVIMGYDMHTPLGAAGPVAAMGGDTSIVTYVDNYLKQVDASKLILAVPYYGYDWPQTEATPSADMVKILPYAEIADQSQNLQLSWDATSETPFFTYTENGQQRIVHYDNIRSLGIKYDFINNENLRGVGIWALGYDGQNQDLEQLLIDKFINQ